MKVDRESDSLERRYFQDLKRYPLLGADEERALARDAQRGDAEARKRLILGNLKLVLTIARGFSMSGVPFLDLVEEGNLGLIKAVGRFDPEKGFRFSTYASWWIRQAIVRAIANQSKTIRIPIHIFHLTMRYISLEQTPEGGRLAEDEMAARLGISLKRCRMLEHLVANIRALDLANSLDAYEQLSRCMPDTDRRFDDPEQVILRQIESENLEKLLERLSDRERLILRIRYGLYDGEPHTLAETGALVRVSRERVRKVEMRALRKLRLLLTRGARTDEPIRKE